MLAKVNQQVQCQINCAAKQRDVQLKLVHSVDIGRLTEKVSKNY